MNLGRYQLGDLVPLSLNATNASGSPSWPSANPTAAIYRLNNSPPTLVETVLLTVCDRYRQTAFFQSLLRLGVGYSVGNYAVCYSWNSGSPLMKTEYFTILPGGNSDGAVISAFGYHRPDAPRVVYLLDSGNLVFGRRPY